MKAKRLRAWLKRMPKDIGHWMLSAWPVWVAAGVPALLLLPLLWCSFASPEKQLQITGGVLQVLALMIIIHGLNTLRKAFRPDEQGFGGAIAASLKRLVSILNPFPAIHGGLGAIELGDDKVHIHGTGGAPPVQIEDRVAKIEKEMVEIRGQIFDLKKTAQVSARKLSEQITDSCQGVWERIANTHLKGLAPELIAVIWLIFGLVLATFSFEVASIFRLERC